MIYLAFAAVSEKEGKNVLLLLHIRVSYHQRVEMVANKALLAGNILS